MISMSLGQRAAVCLCFFFQAEDGIRDVAVTGVQTCALPILPAGSAPLPSTVIMLAVPSEIAGCPRRVLCTPPSTAGTAHPAVLVAAELSGIDTVFKVGGAQAIAALAYGTERDRKSTRLNSSHGSISYAG